MQSRLRHPGHRAVFAAFACAALAVVACAACASAPSTGTAAAGPTGSYAGRLTVDDRPFDATLTLHASGGRGVTGDLLVVSPIEIDGDVRGIVMDDLLRITVTYDGAGGCDGRIEGILDVADGGATVAGPVTITDCREPVAGRMSFHRENQSEPEAAAPSQ